MITAWCGCRSASIACRTFEASRTGQHPGLRARDDGVRRAGQRHSAVPRRPRAAEQSRATGWSGCRRRCGALARTARRRPQPAGAPRPIGARHRRGFSRRPTVRVVGRPQLDSVGSNSGRRRHGGDPSRLPLDLDTFFKVKSLEMDPQDPPGRAVHCARVRRVAVGLDPSAPPETPVLYLVASTAEDHVMPVAQVPTFAGLVLLSDQAGSPCRWTERRGWSGCCRARARSGPSAWRPTICSSPPSRSTRKEKRCKPAATGRGSVGRSPPAAQHRAGVPGAAGQGPQQEAVGFLRGWCARTGVAPNGRR